jgi:hypothetical protein
MNELEKKENNCTSLTESRAVSATMSAQETTRPHALRSRRPMLLMALNAAGRSVRLGGYVLSDTTPPVLLSSSTEPSQPWMKQSWKWMRMSAGISPGFRRAADLRDRLTMRSACGQLLL